MNNEPDLRSREELLKLYHDKDYNKLLKKVKNLLNSFSKSLFLLNLLGIANTELGNYEEAIQNFKATTAINTNFYDAYYNLGIIYKKINSINNSVYYFKECIKFNPKKFEAYNNLGNIYKDKQDKETAVEYYINSLDINPEYLIALQNFGVCLQNFEFTKYSYTIEKHILNLLEKNNILRPVDVINSLIKFVYLNTKYSEIIDNLNKPKSKISLDKSINLFLSIKIISSLLSMIPITDIKIEMAIRNLRYKILLDIESITESEKVIEVSQLIAKQCFINEYIYPITLEEELAISKLEKKINEKLKKSNADKYILEILCLASYKTLNSYSWSNKILDIHKIRDVLKQQIINPITELKIGKNLRSKEILNSTSLKVQDQYENNPYPRWEKIALKNSPSRVIDYFDNLDLKIDRTIINKWDNINVLVAGCGTGQHAITTATKYKNAFITALDLSAQSLSYAKRKAEEFEIKNIEFVQMDLLNLSSYGKKFNIIESVGVLHHMDEPYDGWKILCDNLHFGGLIMIGLYSKIARKHIEKIRNDFNINKAQINKKNIINVRDKIIFSNSDDYELIKLSPDFYSFSNLVDLLFHVKEHTFTIPEISNLINRLKLIFCGFENYDLINFYKKFYGNESDLYNLKLWHEFELNNPRIFAGMYQFWTQKI